MSVAKLERYNLGVAIDNDPDGVWCHHSGHLASVAHLEARIRELEALLRMWHEEAVDEGKHLDSPGCCATWQTLARSTNTSKAQSDV